MPGHYSKGVTAAGKALVGVGKIASQHKNKKVSKAGKTALAVGRTTRQAGRIGTRAGKGASTKKTVGRSANLAKKSVARFA